jgi:5'(3')-deoxyribonucleotidase
VTSKVLIDMDGVVADFVTGAMRLHRKPWIYDQPEYQGPAAWDLAKHWGMTNREFWDGADYDFWLGLPEYPWADELLQAIESEVGIENMCFVTAPAHTYGCVEGKIAWVMDHFPNIPMVLTRSAAGLPAPKHFLAHDSAILIDDYDVNIDNFVAAGGRGIVFPQPWNTECARVADNVRYATSQIQMATAGSF